jgi:predicted DNA-binding protein
MGGKTLRKQVPLYLDDHQVEGLDELAGETGETKQALLRRAVDVLLKDYEWVRKRAGAGNEHRLQRKKPKP